MKQEINGRVYIGPVPDSGPHPGFRGPVAIDVLGVHVDGDSEVLMIRDEPKDWPNSEWQPCEVDELIPWHRVYTIEIAAKS